jgi:hypothetical protein
MSKMLKIITGITLMIWSIFSSANNYPPVSFGEEGGFVDLTLSISKYEKIKNGNSHFIIKNTLNGTKVSFILVLMPTWKAQKIENSESIIYWGNAEIISNGEESNAFIYLLSKLYELPESDLTFVNNVSAQVVGLMNDPAHIETDLTKMKFFLNSDGPDELYSEFYINIDLKNKVLEFNEKDPEYRQPLVNSLAKSA